MKKLLIILLFVLLAGCTETIQTDLDTTKLETDTPEKAPLETKNLETATFAGGCFWCMESAFEALEVEDVVSGYAGGNIENPTYKQVIFENTGHLETIQIFFDPNKVTYAELVQYFWRNIDPIDDGGQFVDRGDQYRTVIFYHNEEQKNIAEKSKENLQKTMQESIVTRIIPFKNFFLAEEYHQDYYKKQIIQYKIYEQGSGRPSRLKELWK